MTLRITKSLNLVSLVFAITGLMSCTEATKGEDSAKVAEKHNEEKFDNEGEKTADFMVYAADLSLHEIQMGELAMGKAYYGSVKSLGKSMAADHRKALQELQQLAAKKNITLPETVSNDKKKDCDKLAKKDQKQFDKEYTEMMVESHKEALKRFEKEAEEGADKEVRQWAFNSLPMLRTHFDHSLELENDPTYKKDTAVVVEHDAAGIKDDDDKKTTKSADSDKDKKAQHKQKDW